MTSSVSFAILAPVPEEHLKSGLDVVAAEEFVAYGSRKWEFFREVDSLRGDEHVPVLIYPSSEDADVKMSYLIKWTGWYIKHVQSELGAHPNGKKYRPATAEKYAGDRSGYWAVYWHVAGLTKLAEENFKPVSSLKSYQTGKYWKAGHPPRGPEIVARPPWIRNGLGDE